jgi:phosphoesterase RecJ-like protein
MSFLKLKAILEEKSSFALICHVEPDGDAIGATLALSDGLQALGKGVSLICKDTVPKVFQFLENSWRIGSELDLAKVDCLILVDNGDFRRTGYQTEIVAAKAKKIPIINIDHHQKNDLWRMVSVNCADEKACSASEIVYKIFIDFNWEITPQVATALLTGIYNDTGGFKHPNTTDSVLEIAAELMRKGAKLKKISENLENSHPVAMFKLWGIALNRLKIDAKTGVSYSIILQDDLKQTGASEEEVSGLVNLLNSAPESKVSLLLYETKDAKIKGSLRTERDDIDVSKLAGLMGGGGHKRAAGFTIEGRIVSSKNGWKIE